MKTPSRQAVTFATLIALVLPLGGWANPAGWVSPNAPTLRNGELLDFGNAPDAEPDGQPSPNAPGDDFDGNDDEDGDSLVDWSNLQWPPSTSAQVGEATENIYGQVWIDGVTSQPGPTPGLAAQLGYGPRGSHPAGHPDWTWVDAAFNVDVGNNDEFMATLTVDTPGGYDYGYRYAWYGGAWTYADLDGSPNGFDPTQAGNLFVRMAATECAKWHQPPDCAIGLDVATYRTEELSSIWVADDFVSDGRPITAVRWWGSYLGYAGPPDLGAAVPGMRPIAFELRWYTDVPAGVMAPWSMPGTLIAAVAAPLLPHAALPPGPGFVSEFFECTTDLSWAQPPVVPPYEHEYQYDLELQTPWLEKEGHIYWLAIQAIYELPPVHPWGWKTTPVLHNGNDAAVIGPATNWMAMTYPPPGWTAITNHPYRGQSVNLAFEMRTDVCPRRCKKWEQPPDMILGTDMPSWRHATLPVGGFPLRADDFISDGRRITDVHWWGSYPGWMKHVPGEADVNPVPPPVGVHRPLGFDLSFHHHDPAPGGLPGPLIEHVFVPMDKCHEVYYGPVDQSAWWLETHFEHEYQYYVDLLDPEVYGAPWYEQAGTHYWINIQAVFDDAFVPGEESHGGWGWKTTPALHLDPSAVSHDGGMVWTHDGLPPPHPLEGAPFDLAFELTTTDVPPLHSPGYVEPAITNLTWHSGAVQGWVTSLGDCLCGYQVLQSATNLLDTPSAFGDLHTNYWPRAVNVWPAASTNRHTYFRVQMRQ